jgi:hypothetical protein
MQVGGVVIVVGVVDPPVLEPFEWGELDDDVRGLSAWAAVIPPANRISPKAIETIFSRTRMIDLPLE